MQQKSAREILREIRRIKWLIEAKRDQLQGLHDRALNVTSSPDKASVSGGGVSNKIEEMAVKCVSLEEEIADLILKMELKKNQIINRINGLENVKHSEILYRVYVRDEKVSFIADAMGFSEDWVKHLHQEALAAFEDKYMKNK